MALSYVFIRMTIVTKQERVLFKTSLEEKVHHTSNSRKKGKSTLDQKIVSWPVQKYTHIIECFQSKKKKELLFD